MTDLNFLCELKHLFFEPVSILKIRKVCELLVTFRKFTFVYVSLTKSMKIFTMVV